jgi:glycosyltransferase involved in cell wall biosynthesis
MEVSHLLMVAGPLGGDGPSCRTLDLAREFTMRGLRVEVFTSGGAALPQSVRMGVPIFQHRGIRAGWFSGVIARSVLDRARQFGPQVIHSQSVTLSRVAARLARASRCVYVVSCGTCAEASQRLYSSRRFRGIIAPDEGVREDLVNKASIPKSHIRVIPDGIDVDSPPPPHAGSHVPVVGMVAPAERGEGQDDFLHAARLLTDRGIEAQFVVGGAGPLLGRHRRLAAKLGIQRLVTFACRVTHYRSVLGAADVLVVPSLRDGNTRLVLDAIACQRPVVATGTGCLPNIIRDGETGLLVHKNSPEEIADAVAVLLSDAPLAERLTRAAIALVTEHYNLAQMVERTLDFYDRAANRELS